MSNSPFTRNRESASGNLTSKPTGLPPEGGQQVSVNDFLQSATTLPIIDVRSPFEFEKGHIPSAYNIPLFKDDERAIVGTIYKQHGKEDAIERGLQIVGPKMLRLANKALEIAVDGRVLVHCWRGGMRSNRMAWLFEQNGLSCSVLEGGYKAYRNHILAKMGELKNLMIIAGPTGSGKTDILHEMKKLGSQIVDLEGLANHRGSAFGAIGMPEQPSSQQFQNNLYAELSIHEPNKPIWIESESLTIGRCYLPQPFWQAMNRSPSIKLIMDRKIRVERLVNDYGTVSKKALADSMEKIRQNFGGNRVKRSLELLSQNDLSSVAALLLEYYDKRYAFGRKKNCIGYETEVETHTGDPAENARMILAKLNKNESRN